MAIQINDNIHIRAGKPIDYKFGPFLSIQEANQSILIEERYSGLIFGIYTNPSDILNSDIIHYYYFGGLTDTDISNIGISSDDITAVGFTPTILTLTRSTGDLTASIPIFNQNTTGNASTATLLQTARTLTIGSTGKTFNGGANVSWTLTEIGAEPLFNKNTGFNKNFGTTSGTVAEGNDSRFHTPITLGTANGLSLVDQILSLSLANTNTTGALSSSDWNIFNGKIGGTIASGQIPFGTGTNVVGGDNGLVWDNVNKRLGVNLAGGLISTAQATLHISNNAIIGNRNGTNGSLKIQSNQGPDTTITQVGDNLGINGSTGAPASAVVFGGKIFSVQFTTAGGGTFYIPRSNRNSLGDNVSGLLIENQITTQSNGTATFITTKSEGAIIRSTAFGSTGQSGDMFFEFGGFNELIQRNVIFKKNGNVLVNTETDAGFRLDVNGTARVQGDAIITGNVGIGTTAPSEKLDVNGTARIRTITNATGNFATYSATGVLQERTAAEVSAEIGGVYGVEWNKTFATQVCTRVGDMTLHNAVTGLPVQSRIRKCLMMDDGVVNYYLNPENSLLRADGFASNLDGTDGQVMMEIPEHWRRFDTVGDIQRVQISEASFAGSHRVPKTYISAFEASVFRPTSKLSSVINTSVDYRGGNNTAAWDLEDRTLLGMPATSISRINFTTFARNRGALWNQYLYEAHKTLLWLYTIEYATRSSQLAFNPDLTADNFRQGGLGDGVTNIVSSAWGNFNSFNPFIACGAGGLDDFTSSLAITHPVLGATQIPKYRGIEHPFGHIWKWTEGINIRAGNGRNMIYKANSNDFRSGDYQGYIFAGDQAAANGFIRDLTFGKDGDILAGSTSGASATTFWGDQLFQSIPATGESLRGLRFGGSAHTGSNAGFVYSRSFNVPSIATTDVGSRLCFMGA